MLIWLEAKPAGVCRPAIGTTTCFLPVAGATACFMLFANAVAIFQALLRRYTGLRVRRWAVQVVAKEKRTKAPQKGLYCKSAWTMHGPTHTFGARSSSCTP